MINAAIPLQVRQPRKTNALAEMAQVMQLKNAQRQGKMQDAQLAKQNAIQEALAASGGDVNKMRDVYAQFGDIDKVAAIDKHGRDTLKSQRDEQTHQIDMALKRTDAISQLLGAAVDQPSYDAARQRITALDPDAGMPEVFDPAWVQQNRMMGLKVAEQLSHQMNQAKFAESQRHNRATEGAAWAGVAARRDAAGAKGRESNLKGAKDLRGEFIKQSGDYVKIRDAYSRIEASASDPSPAGDLSMIYAYMKILDPGSTVMQGEQASAQNAGGVSEVIRGKYNAIVGGGSLSPKVRADFVARAKKLYKSQERSHGKLKREYRRLAKRQNVDPENVIVDLSIDGGLVEPSSPTPPAPVTASSAATPAQAAELQRLREKLRLNSRGP